MKLYPMKNFFRWCFRPKRFFAKLINGFIEISFGYEQIVIKIFYHESVGKAMVLYV